MRFAQQSGGMMHTSFRSTLIAAMSAALLALAPSAFAAGQATDMTVGNSTGAPHAAVNGEHQPKGMQTAETRTSGSSDMSRTGQMGKTSGPAVHSNVVPNTAVTKHQETGTQTAETGTTGESEMNSRHKAALGAGAPGTAAKAGTEAGRAPGHEASQQ